MAPHADVMTDAPDDGIERLPAPERPAFSKNPPRFVIIGAGNRGNAYADAVKEASNGFIVGVVEPITFKRQQLGRHHIWGKGQPAEGQEFTDWKEFVDWELKRRERVVNGEENVPEGPDGVFVCVQDEMHVEVLLGLAPLNIHILCEKPLATSLDECVSIYKSLLSATPDGVPTKIFSIGHVLRYSPHNVLLRKLLLDDKVIGDILSINHTEPVGFWHFAHSYVRGNWRKESKCAPSLLTKSCHDIDVLMWLLASPPPGSSKPAHLPTTVSSAGTLQYFTRHRKPEAAKDATNCFSCDFEPQCQYSSKKIYLGKDLRGLGSGNTGWPVRVVLPEIEECIELGGRANAEKVLEQKLRQDYDQKTPEGEVTRNQWYGRCVYESDNDVCDDQTVTMTWEADPIALEGEGPNAALAGRGAKIALFHMVAFTRKQCQRFSNIYGTNGEIYADEMSITVDNFLTGEKKTHYPAVSAGGHGGGDRGLARQYVLAVDRVKNHGEDVASAQQEYIGCSLEEIIRSHAMVFAAEEARHKEIVVDFPSWWVREVQSRLAAPSSSSH